MKVLVVGNGGREHAIIWKLAKSPRVSTLYCAPGNAGIASMAECVPISADDIAGLKRFAQERRVDLTVVGPELPLSLGIADEFRQAKLKIFGPTRNAARIEASKDFAKTLMFRCNIPTPRARTFQDLDQARQWIDRHGAPIVVKADGLAQGKGVVVARTTPEAEEAVTAMLAHRKYGEAGARVILEDYLEGEELTVMAFADGRTVVPMVPAQDHKRVGEGDTGPNTGGMGAYAPAPLGTETLRMRILREVLYPAVEGLSRVGSPFYGVLYAGLMITKDGQPQVLEFNARFGDPETQVVLPLLKTDLLDILEAVAEHRLDQLPIEWHDRAAVCVVMTSKGYPGSYATGTAIQGVPPAIPDDEVVVFHAGTRKDAHGLVTNGGRVLGVTGMGQDLQHARRRAYEAVNAIAFDGAYFRRDIAGSVLSKGR